MGFFALTLLWIFLQRLQLLYDVSLLRRLVWRLAMSLPQHRQLLSVGRETYATAFSILKKFTNKN